MSWRELAGAVAFAVACLLLLWMMATAVTGCHVYCQEPADVVEWRRDATTRINDLEAEVYEPSPTPAPTAVGHDWQTGDL